MKLSEKGQNMANLLLKHYPLTANNHMASSETHTQHKQPTQHLHDYRKVRNIKLRNAKYTKNRQPKSSKTWSFSKKKEIVTTKIRGIAMPYIFIKK